MQQEKKKKNFLPVRQNTMKLSFCSSLVCSYQEDLSSKAKMVYKQLMH